MGDTPRTLLLTFHSTLSLARGRKCISCLEWAFLIYFARRKSVCKFPRCVIMQQPGRSENEHQGVGAREKGAVGNEPGLQQSSVLINQRPAQWRCWERERLAAGEIINELYTARPNEESRKKRAR